MDLLKKDNNKISQLSKIKILCIFPNSINYPGGLEINTKMLIDLLRKYEEVKIDVLVEDPNNKVYLKSVIKGGVRYIYDKPISLIGKRFRIYHTFKFLLKYYKNYDLLIINSFVYPSSVQAAIFKRLVGIPSLVRILGNVRLSKIESPSILHRIIRWGIWLLNGIKGKIVIDSADAITSDSKEDLSIMHKRFLSKRKKNNYFIHNCVDFVPNNPNERKEDSKRRIYLTFIGRLTKLKGFHDFIKIVETINIKIKNIPILVIGKGDELYSLLKEKQKSLNITYIPSVSHERIYEYYQQSRILIFPSYVEGMPGVILEAMATGTPIVSTDVGAISSLITNGENGFLFKPGDIETAVEHTLKLLQDIQLQQKFISKSLNIVKKYKCTNLSKKYVKIIKKIVLA
ncbi:MAG: glycosyltransferase family 4 protein [Promethearchaeota archaeon]